MAALTSLEKGIELLRNIAVHGSGCGMARLAAETGIPRTSVIRLVTQLERAGLVARAPNGNGFAVGPALISYALTAPENSRWADQAGNILAWLAERTSETNYLSVRHGLDALCVARWDGSTPIRAVTLDIGTRRPLGVGAASTAVLSALPEDEAAEILELNADRFKNSAPAFDLATIRNMIDSTRHTGISIHESESVPGVICFGAPVRDADGRACAAISLSFVADQVSGEQRSDYTDLLVEAAAKLERRLRTGSHASRDIQRTRAPHAADGTTPSAVR